MDVSAVTGIAYSDVYELVDELTKKDLLTKVKPLFKRKKSGKKPIFFGLTQKGLKELILDPDEKLTSSNFWDLLFDCYNSDYKKTNGDNVVELSTIDYVMELYMWDAFKISRKRSPILFEILFRNKLIEIHNDESFLKKIIPLLNIIGLYGKITISKLLKNKYVKQYYNSLSDFDKTYFLDEIVDKGLLVKQFNKKNNVAIINVHDDIEYYLSHSGLILVLEDLLKTNKLTKEEFVRDKKGILENDFIKTTDKIAKNYSFMLPMIFDNNRMRKNRKNLRIGYYVQIKWLVDFYFESFDNEHFALSKPKVWSSLNLFKMMKPVYSEKFSEIRCSGEISLEKWAKHEKRFSYFKGQLPGDIYSRDYYEFTQKFSKIIPHHTFANTILHRADDIVLSTQSHVSKYTRSSLKEKNLQYKSSEILWSIRKPLEKLLELDDIFHINERTARFDKTIIERDSSVEFETVGNVMSFHYYTILQFLDENNKLTNAIHDDEELNTWYFDWIDTLKEFAKDNLQNIESLTHVN